MSKTKRLLIQAIRDGNELDFSLYLTKVGTGNFQFDTHKQTPLHVAIQCDMLEMAETLIAHGADVNRGNRSGVTALHVAVTRKNLDSIKMLISHKACPNQKTLNNISPFDIAIRQQDGPILYFLKEMGGAK